jgi:hypothetical protein
LIKYVDEVQFTTGVFYYKLTAFNNCGRPVTSSNLASSILLTGSADNNVISLDWNEYVDWKNGVGYYTIYRETGAQGGVLDSIRVGENTYFRDDFTNRIDYVNPQSSQVCYQVSAVESQSGAPNTSRSNRLCFSLNPDVHIPNAFIPNSDDGINNTFGPIFSFLPEKYDLVIYNRSGLKIWEGSGPWDGRVHGNPVSEGVYLYLLKVHNYSSAVHELSGQVAIVYR